MSAAARALACIALLLSLAGCRGSRPVDAGPAFLQSLALPSVGPTRHDVRKLQGKVVLVSFFATWCFPCLAEMPTLEALQRDYGAQGLQVVSVGMDLEGTKVLQPFAEHYAPRYPVLVASEWMIEGRSPFGPIKGLPTTVLLDRRGRAVAGWQGVEGHGDVAKAIEKLLKQD
ncbi:TlpA family protein disulfide reductase [Myxococcus llanfairpwllgwyngyllgogerychwyrndrobwllllantysiliogogogochensis]|uniref:TlpA family protein disulfide reductase n=1 Tax=Myxococcus llanfairpwllgwyngyllgogerychwyrndrobwllllantysiliogogogochensis TaxID=2590453 RepID=A0A540WKH8_9BACT|nr:TlpA disulfide reductase family protein [Myxococcus llanfairpwllgwyngyllgogerychwyrndrobwllllantysiliogogogochensis]TQF09516.1 TlpA family protein disulfide reductase [Myxococcus llanfairpwllgwyngyllgogerychwyrndrobwllllantysiliogogogochensis]